MRARVRPLPVLYELVRSDVEQLFEKQPSIKEQIISIDHERKRIRNQFSKNAVIQAFTSDGVPEKASRSIFVDSW